MAYGWSRFQADIGTWLGIMVVWLAINMVLGIFFRNSDSWVILTLVNIVRWILLLLLLNAATQAALAEIDGQRTDLATFFRFKNFRNFTLTALLVWIVMVIGFFLLVIPGVVWMFFTWWWNFFVIDRDQGPVTSIRSSVDAIRSHLSGLFVLALIIVGLLIVSILTCGIGFLVTVPITVIASAWAYRTITGGPVAPMGPTPGH